MPQLPLLLRFLLLLRQLVLQQLPEWCKTPLLLLLQALVCVDLVQLLFVLMASPALKL